MKKIITLIAGFLLGFSNPVNAEVYEYREFNAGMSGLNPYGNYHDPFPGASLLKSSVYTNNKAFFETQFGVAFPTIVTAKIGAGLDFEKARISFGFRFWPATYGPQIEIKSKDRSIIMSYEISTTDDFPFSNHHLVTFGIRWEPKIIRL